MLLYILIAKAIEAGQTAFWMIVVMLFFQALFFVLPERWYLNEQQ
jgi:hypothetical protein